VFALNLSPHPVSLSLAKGDQVLVGFENLASMESRPLARLDAVEGAVLRLETVPGTEPLEWTDPSGTPYQLQFRAGELYAIVVDPQGKAALYSLPETYSDDPKVCIVNGLGRVLSQVQVAPDWAKNVKIYTQDVVPVVPSEFYSVPAKSLGLYWQTVDQTLSGAHETARGFDGKPLRQAFEADHYYLLLAGATEGVIRDLTPHLD